MTVAIDSDRQHATYDLVTDDGPYASQAEAEQAGKDAATDWCIEHGVNLDDDRTYVMFTKRTNFPKLGYIIDKLNQAGIASRINGESWHAPILEVDENRFKEAWAILDERHGRYRLDDVRDDHPKFAPYAETFPQSTDDQRLDDIEDAVGFLSPEARATLKPFLTREENE